MRKLSTYIEYTLMTRHYAFVPGIGGFLLRDVDASYSNKIFTPSHREIHFNRFLTNDDGMLANAYMTAEGISYDEAISQIRIEVAGIKSLLDRKNKCELENLGVLSYDSDHHLTLKRAQHFPLDPDCYGLSMISLRPWQEIEVDNRNKETKKTNKAEVVTIPKYWLRRAVACLLVVLFCFSNFNPSHIDRTPGYASMFNTNILFGNASPKNQAEESWEKSWESEEVLAEAEKAIISTAPTETSVTENNFVSNEKKYYIIIASCTSAAEAERVVAKRQKEGFAGIGILECNGRYRLYLKSFNSRTEGESYLEEVRLTTPFQKAWLLPYRQESLLSYYLKNLDNDLLPMELSHPHQRTERDQGWINT